MKILLVHLLFVIVCVCTWFVNLYKLTQCDFEAPYKGEAIHAVGLIGPAALLTVWSDSK